MLKFGICEKDITPQIGMNMPGYFHFRPSQGILDPLYVKAMAFENNGEYMTMFNPEILKQQ